jgi:hypothetical protein
MARIEIPGDDDFDYPEEAYADDEEDVERCYRCGDRRADAVDEFNDVRLALCAGCATELLGSVFQAMAAGVRRRGGTAADHQRVLNELQRRYRYAAGLPDGNGIEAFLNRHQPPREQGGR